MANRSGDPPYGLTVDLIQRDLRDECPPWILSCYGPGKDAPEQLFGGYPREQCFEEIRLHYMQGAMSGNPQGAIAEIEGLYNTAQQQIQHTLSNVNAAIQFLADAATKHPNRLDVCRQSTPNGGTAGVFSKDKSAFGSTPNAFQSSTPSNNPFGAPASTGGGFGQPSTLGQKSNPFGTPAFGQPSQPTSAFGQPATLGNNAPFGQGTSAFGQTSTLGAKPSPFGTPAFGQPAQPATAFGQPSQPSGPFANLAKPDPSLSFSQLAASKPAFGQPSQPTGGPAFGQPSQPVGAFGQPSTLGQKPSPFGAPSGPSPFAQQTSSNAFGQPSQTASSSPFGQTAQTTITTSPFGQPATTAPATNPFGQPATSNPFGQPTTAASSPFGAPQSSAPSATPFGAPAPSPFGTAAAPAVPFGQPAHPAQPGPSLFGKPSSSPFGGGVTGTGTFGSGNTPAAPAKPNVQGSGPYAPDATRQHPDPSSYSSKGPDGKLRMFKGKPVSYQTLGSKLDKQFPVLRAFDGTITRIWFPDGPPNYSAETEASDRSLYQDLNIKEQWNAFVQTESFADGLMPEVPPLREFCKWDF